MEPLTARELIEALLLFPMEEPVEARLHLTDRPDQRSVSLHGRSAHVDLGGFDDPLTEQAENGDRAIGFDAAEANRRIQRVLDHISKPIPGQMVGATTIVQMLGGGR